MKAFFIAIILGVALIATNARTDDAVLQSMFQTVQLSTSSPSDGSSTPLSGSIYESAILGRTKVSVDLSKLILPEGNYIIKISLCQRIPSFFCRKIHTHDFVAPRIDDSDNIYSFVSEYNIRENARVLDVKSRNFWDIQVTLYARDSWYKIDKKVSQNRFLAYMFLEKNKVFIPLSPTNNNGIALELN
jgi:hypothetical protein